MLTSASYEGYGCVYSHMYRTHALYTEGALIEANTVQVLQTSTGSTVHVVTHSPFSVVHPLMRCTDGQKGIVFS